MKQISLLLVVIAFYQAALGQRIQGTVKGSDKKPLSGATIQNLSRDQHVHSMENGYFIFPSAAMGDTLLVSHVSYAGKQVMVDSAFMSIVLEHMAFQLDDVMVHPQLKHLNILSAIDLQTNPVTSSQEILRKIPGLFIGQHAGGGKAEQIFLRGFDIDHGTDISITVDGMPVNMVSHAHGQGYADLHFLIPEAIEKIDFDKGPYVAAKGNFATAGYVDFQTRERLDASSVTLEKGMFGHFRGLGMINLLNSEKEAAWAGIEFLQTDGFFESPQNFNRMNVMGKYSRWLNTTDKISVTLSHLSSQWDASGQIPQRAVDQRLISRFGAIDDTEGGNTSRSNFSVQYHKQINPQTFIRNTAYLNRYDFELYSNFTFFLEDELNGDQIRQKEQRSIAGFNSELQHNTYLGNWGVELRAGIGLRDDQVKDNELSHTLNRKTTLNPIMLGDVHETNLSSFAQADFSLGKWVVNAGLRYDQFRFQYTDKLPAQYTVDAVHKGMLSPKVNIIYNQDQRVQYFLKLGKGFHSNDTRVVIARNGQTILPPVYGADLGLILKPIPRMVLNAAAWYLFSEQEFVYVGDAGIVEPSGRSVRKGIDLGLRYQLGRYLFLHGDATYTHARAIDEAKGEDLIPLAPKVTAAGGLSYKHPSGFNSGIRARYLGDRPANEDNSIVAKGYFIADANAGFEWKRFGIGLIAENIFDVAWNETQFATESRLRNEPASVTEIHFTPGTPFNLRGYLKFKF